MTTQTKTTNKKIYFIFLTIITIMLLFKSSKNEILTIVFSIIVLLYSILRLYSLFNEKS